MSRLLFLPLLFAAGCGPASRSVDPGAILEHGGIVRGDATRPEIALVFTGDRYADGGWAIRDALSREDVAASFFFTGRFYRDPDFADLIRALASDGHYLGAHSDRHLLYAAWEVRDSTLVDLDTFRRDVRDNYAEMARFGITRDDAPLFMPPYEWYNAEIARWTLDLGLHLVNFSTGTRANADYTTPDLGAGYVPSDVIWKSVFDRERADPNGLNGFILLMHVGTAPERTDKFHDRIGELLAGLRGLGYTFVRIDDLVLR